VLGITTSFLTWFNSNLGLEQKQVRSLILQCFMLKKSIKKKKTNYQLVTLILIGMCHINVPFVNKVHLVFISVVANHWEFVSIWSVSV